MAEQTEQATKAQQESKRKFNRQINFYVMRHMWQVIRGRSATDRIYECFGMSRERYTRIIKTGQLRYKKGELDKLEQLTGISKKIFEGEERFICHIGKSEESAISDEEWKKLLSDETIDDKEKKLCQQKLHKKLKIANRDDLSTWNFQRLCYFLKEKKAAPLQPPDQTIRGIQKAIRNLTFDLVEQCDAGQLNATYKLLREKYNMVSHILQYREEKNRARNAQQGEREGRKGTK